MTAESKGVESNLTIQISDVVWEKVFHWIQKSPVEISGLGKVVFDAKTGIFQVIDAYLVEQENGAAETEMKDSAVAKLMFEQIQADPDIRNNKRKLAWWWHSHVNMGAFWSGTDHDTIRKIGGQGWAIATVFNKRREYRSAYIQANPNPFMIDNIPTRVGALLSQEIMSAWDSEYDSKVTEKKSYHVGSAGSKSGYRGGPYGAWDEDSENPQIRENLREYYKNFPTPPHQPAGFLNRHDAEKPGTPEAASGSSNEEVTTTSSDDGVELSEGVEMLPYEEGSADPTSIDPRDGDNAEMDALDMMQQSFNRAGKKFHE